MLRHVIVLVLLTAFLCVGCDLDVPFRPSARPVGQQGNWTLLFDDEFHGTTLRSDKWTNCYWWAHDGGCTIDTNNELEWYQPSEVQVQDGTLSLRAGRRPINVGGKTYPFISGMITTGPTGQSSGPARFAFQYGYVEVRATVPRGKGLWPAFWMLPANRAERPEIDIFEILGDQPDALRMSLHSARRGSPEDLTQEWTGPDFSADWHTFGLDWEPTSLVWYVDGVECWRIMEVGVVPAQPMYLVANLAVGGDWAGWPDRSTSFPSEYQIRYVRVWSKAG